MSELNSEMVMAASNSEVPKTLHRAAEIYEQRNAIYGNNYRRFGPVLALVLAGQQLNPADPDEMNRLGILVQIVAKLTRYGENFTRGGHDDSLDDNIVYSAMLKELDQEIRAGCVSQAFVERGGAAPMAPTAPRSQVQDNLHVVQSAPVDFSQIPHNEAAYESNEAPAPAEEELETGLGRTLRNRIKGL